MSEPERLTLSKRMREIPLREEDRPETREPWTPGPWRVSGCRQRTKQGTDDYLIEHGNAETFSPGLAQVMSDGGRLPVEANARLIAEAPEMADLLKRIVADEDMHGRYSGPASEARAILRRVRGEAC